jgi:DNA-binding protein HU-beta
MEGPVMTKKDLVVQLAQARGITPREARTFVDAFLGSIERVLTEGQSVTFRSFGRFEVRRRVGRTLRTPGGSHEVSIPARLAPVFHSAPGFEKRLARGRAQRTGRKRTG